MKQRRIVQIAVATNVEKSGEFRERLYAVAEDGTVWRLDDADIMTGQGQRKMPSKKSSRWSRILPLPGIDDDQAAIAEATTEGSPTSV